MWFFYALVFALVTAVSVLVAKRVMKDIDEYLYLALSNLIAIPFLLLIVIYFYQIPRVDEIFLQSVAVSSSIGVLAAFLAYLIWAITPIFEKTAIMHTVPQVPPFVSLVGFSISAVVFSALALNKSKINLTTVTMLRKLSPYFLAIGILSPFAENRGRKSEDECEFLSASEGFLSRRSEGRRYPERKLAGASSGFGQTTAMVSLKLL